MRIQVEGLNLHHKFKISIKKPLGGGSSFLNNVVKHPGATIASGVTGPINMAQGALLDNANSNALNKAHDTVAQMNRYPGQDQGQSEADLIQRKYDELAANYSASADPLRAKLAQSLTDSGANLFKQATPGILQDLNARGLFTSPSGVNEAQSKALADIAASNRDELNNFDTDVFSNVQNLKATGTGSSLQRLFDVHDQAAQSNLAQMLGRRSSRDSLIASLLGLGGKLGAAYIAS